MMTGILEVGCLGGFCHCLRLERGFNAESAEDAEIRRARDFLSCDSVS